MTQQNSTVNLLIHDAYGQPQMIKVVQGTPSKSFSHLVKTSISGQPTKTVFKTVTTQDNTQSVLTTASPSQVLRTIGVPAGKLGSSKFVQLQTVGQQKPIDEQTVQKIRLASSQVSQSGLRIVSQHQKISPQQSVINTSNSKTFISPILDHTGGGRKKHDLDNDYVQPEFSSKRRRTEKVGKGLRHFSMKVCEKVRKKGTTSYNEVADELVQEFTNPSNVTNSSAEQYDQKNIRRRVYDALNVLMAMNIISKEKKEIRWLGLPTNSLQECLQLEKEKQKKIESIKHKTQHLHDLIFQQISFKNLVERNRENQKVCGVPTSNSTIPLPFIIVSTDKKTCVECSISSNKMEYNFTFDNKFEVNDDIEVLKRIGMLMGLDEGTMNKTDTKKAKAMLPKSLENYVEQLAQGCSDPIDEIMSYSEDSDAGPSSVCHPMVEIMDSGDGDQDMSRHSSYSDPLSPNAQEFSDEEQEWDESDVDIN